MLATETVLTGEKIKINNLKNTITYAYTPWISDDHHFYGAYHE